MSLTDHQFSEVDSRLVVHSAPSSRGDSSVYDKVHFDFYTKTLHAAQDALLQTRSSYFRTTNLYQLTPGDPGGLIESPWIQTEKTKKWDLRRPAEQDKDIWKRKPPDFRYVVYDPHPPKRNTVDSMQPWRYGTIPGQREVIKRVRSEGHLPRLLEDDSNDEGTQFKTRFRFERPFTAKKKFVASGSYKPGEYESPKPHDFRGYAPIKSLGLDEFVTDYEKDPNGMKFKTKRLNHIFGLPNEPPERDLVPGRQMGKPMSGKKHWDPQLILEKDDWPRKSAAFTRHRRRHRQAYSAFMERVENALNSAWTQEMFSQEILSQ